MSTLQNRFALSHRWTCLKVLYSSHYGSSPQMGILKGLRRFLEGKPATPVVVGDYILLLGSPQAITRSVWGSVIGWLMEQPEVVFVHRVTATWGKV